MKILLTGAFNWKKEYLKIMQESGHDIIMISREDAPLNDEHYKVDAVVCNWLFVHHNISDFPNLNYIQLLSAGMDRVPLDYIKEKSIVIHNARGVYSIPMAEYAVSAVLQLYKNSYEFHSNQKKHIWKKNRNLKELSGKRVCVVGTGSVGSEVGRLFSVFTPEIYGVDLYPYESEYFKHIYPIDCLDEQLSLSDVVVVTLPLTDETRNIFDEHRFSVMKDQSVFVNIARGGLVDEKALLDALDRKLFGAASYVFVEEPLSEESLLWDKPNLIISPHNSFVSENNEDRMWNLIYNNLRSYGNG